KVPLCFHRRSPPTCDSIMPKPYGYGVPSRKRTGVSISFHKAGGRILSRPQRLRPTAHIRGRGYKGRISPVAEYIADERSVCRDTLVIDVIGRASAGDQFRRAVVACARHAQRREYALVHESGKWLSADPLGNHAQQDVARVGISPVLSGCEIEFADCKR